MVTPSAATEMARAASDATMDREPSPSIVPVMAPSEAMIFTRPLFSTVALPRSQSVRVMSAREAPSNTQAAADGRAKHFAKQCSQNAFGSGIYQSAHQRAEHTAGKGQQTAQAQQIADQRRGKRRSQSIAGAQQHATQNIDHVLNRGTFAAENRKGKQASHHCDRTKHTGYR